MILKEARAQFIEMGFQKVSMRSIAKQLGCSHGALYYHFSNKAELFYAIIEEYFNRLNQLIEEVVNRSAGQQTKLKNLLLCFIEFGLTHQSQYEMMFMFKNNEVHTLSQEAANLSYQRFAQSVQALSPNKLPISEIYSAFLALHGFVSHYHSQVDHFEEAKEAAHIHVNFIIKALTH
ncbi:TetR/AcrR family transcriptional regulator [Alkalihalophilus lindianensis]|uniref:TetR/AcrR family transcriptional regulator n=1 Tax=Alkalihalophilus lindianensis TaxID=1630542 RepID=A0ABU3X588_9BACI|nr:TetR/AcrR family transcriptional regulator [Alkalihalophilus lindianensis]MDV2682802.1 TetR/AcrR family transcriptional regulator [Alkalihalophilus lindianensis]